MYIGQKVLRVPVTFYNTDKNGEKNNMTPLPGRVCYIHPKGRYHTVEFETRGGKVRESFQGVED